MNIGPLTPFTYTFQKRISKNEICFAKHFVVPWWIFLLEYNAKIDYFYYLFWFNNSERRN